MSATERISQHAMTRAAIAGAMGGNDRKWVDINAIAAGLPPPSWGDADPFDGSNADDLTKEAQDECARIEEDAKQQLAARKKRRRR